MSEGFTIPLNVVSNIDAEMQKLQGLAQAQISTQQAIARGAEAAAKAGEEHTKRLLKTIEDAATKLKQAEESYSGKVRPKTSAPFIQERLELAARPESLSKLETEFVRVTTEVKKFSEQLAAAVLQQKELSAAQNAAFNALFQQKKAIIDLTAANKVFDAGAYRSYKTLQLENAEKKRSVDTWYDINKARQSAASERDKLLNQDYVEAIRLKETNRLRKEEIIETVKLAGARKKLTDQETEFSLAKPISDAAVASGKGISTKALFDADMKHAAMALQQIETAHAKEMLLLLPKMRNEKQKIAELNQGEARRLRDEIIGERAKQSALDDTARRKARLDDDTFEQIKRAKELASEEKQRLAPTTEKLKLDEKLAELRARSLPANQQMIADAMVMASEEKKTFAGLRQRLSLEEKLEDLKARAKPANQQMIADAMALASAEKKSFADLRQKLSLEEKLADLKARAKPANQQMIEETMRLASAEKIRFSELQQTLALREKVAQLDARATPGNQALQREAIQKQSAERISNLPIIEETKLREKLEALKARSALRGTADFKRVTELSNAEKRQNAVMSEREKLETRLAVLQARRSSSMQALIKQVKDLEAAERRANAATRSLGDSMIGLNQLNASLRSGLTALGASFGIYTSGTIMAAGATYAMIAAIRSTIAVGAEFQTEYARVGAVMQLTAQQTETVKDVSMELAASSRYSSTQVMQAFREMGMAGLKYQEAMAGIRSVLSLASIGNMDFSRATDIATNVTYGFGLETEQLTRVVDVMAKTVTNSNQDIEQLGNTMSYAAPIASSFGISLELTSAMTEVLANSGIKASRAGTALRRTLTALFSESEGVTKQLGELGVYVNSTADDMDQELLRVLKALNKATMGATFNTGNLVKAVGLYAAPGFLKLVKAADESVKSLEEIYKATKDVEGAAFAMQKRIEDTLAVDWENFTSSIDAVKQRIFDLYSGDLRELVKEMTSFSAALAGSADSIKALSESLEGYLKALGMIAGALAAIAIAGAGLKALIRIATSFKKLAKGAGAGRWLSGLRLLMSAGWLIALGTTVMLLKEMYDTLTGIERVQVDPLRSPNFLQAEDSLREDLGYSQNQRISLANEGQAIRLYESKRAIEELKKEITLNEENLEQQKQFLEFAGERKRAEDALKQAVTSLQEKQVSLLSRLQTKEAEYIRAKKKMIEDELVQLELDSIRLPLEIWVKENELQKLRNDLAEAARQAAEDFDRVFSVEFWSGLFGRAKTGFGDFAVGFATWVEESSIGFYDSVIDAAKDPAAVFNSLGEKAKAVWVGWMTGGEKDLVDQATASLDEMRSALGEVEGQVESLNGELGKLNAASLVYDQSVVDSITKSIDPLVKAVQAEQAARRKLEESSMSDQQQLESVRAQIAEFEKLRDQLLASSAKAADAKAEIQGILSAGGKPEELDGARLQEYERLKKIIEENDNLVGKVSNGLGDYTSLLEKEADLLAKIRQSERESGNTAMQKVIENLKLRGKHMAAINVERKLALQALPPYLRALQQENWAIEDSNALQSKLADTLEALGQTKAATQIRNEAELRSTNESQRALVKLTQTYAELDRKVEQMKGRAQAMASFRDEILAGTTEAASLRQMLSDAGLLEDALQGFDVVPIVDRVQAVRNEAGNTLSSMNIALENYGTRFSDTTTQTFQDLSTKISEIVEQIKEKLQSLPALSLNLEVVGGAGQPYPTAEEVRLNQEYLQDMRREAEPTYLHRLPTGSRLSLEAVNEVIDRAMQEIPYVMLRFEELMREYSGQTDRAVDQLYSEILAFTKDQNDQNNPLARHAARDLAQRATDAQRANLGDNLSLEVRGVETTVQAVTDLDRASDSATTTVRGLNDELERTQVATRDVMSDPLSSMTLSLKENLERLRVAKQEYFDEIERSRTTSMGPDETEQMLKRLDMLRDRYQGLTKDVSRLSEEIDREAAKRVVNDKTIEGDITKRILMSEAISKETRYRTISKDNLDAYNQELERVRMKYDGAYVAALDYADALLKIQRAQEQFKDDPNIDPKIFDDERRAELEKYKNSVAEAGNEWDRYSRELEEASNLQKIYVQMADQLAATLVDGAMQGKIAWEDFGRAIARMLMQLAMNQLFIALIGGIQGWLGSGTSGLGAGSGTGSLSDWHATGTVPHGAKGGVMAGPKGGYPAVLHGTEAVVPLPDGRAIPVEWQGAQQKAPTIKVTVNTLPGQSANVRDDGQGGLTIDIVRAALADDANRGGVPWVSALSRRARR